MIRQHGNSPLVMPGPLFLSLLGVAFCAWSASGNALNLCFTSGCSLYQDLTIAGISMWWLGAVGFGALAFLAVSGRPWLGIFIAGSGLVVDTILLLLMLTTAPCVGCLFVALIFALVYVAFRHSGTKQEPVARSWLVLVWSVLFITNVGAVVRAEMGTWAMHGPVNATVRLYFSPSCSSCREALNSLSGRVNVAFYPVAENEQDLQSIALMIKAVDQGSGMAEALESLPKQTLPLSVWQQNSPEMLLLRFRALRNKAHVLASGSQVVPFIEYQGLPSALSQKSSDRPKPGASVSSGGVSGASSSQGASQDATLPIDGDIAGSCGGANTAPCP